MQDQINAATEILKQGGLILYPTDTIWGIRCDATNEEAVKRIYKLKKRSDSKSLIVLIDNDVRLQRTVEEVPEVAWDIMDYSKKPVTAHSMAALFTYSALLLLNLCFSKKRSAMGNKTIRKRRASSNVCIINLAHDLAIRQFNLGK